VCNLVEQFEGVCTGCNVVIARTHDDLSSGNLQSAAQRQEKFASNIKRAHRSLPHQVAGNNQEWLCNLTPARRDRPNDAVEKLISRREEFSFESPKMQVGDMEDSDHLG
jgi:predicted Fe-S protein YdhL (DUF1289 family)